MLYQATFNDLYISKRDELLEIAKRKTFHQYLFRAMKNAYLKEQQRYHNRTSELTETIAFTPPRLDTRIAFYQVLSELPQTTRKVVCAYAGHQTDREVAESCGLTIRQVECRRYAAKRVFQKYDLGNVAGLAPAPFLLELFFSKPTITQRFLHTTRLITSKVLHRDFSPLERATHFAQEHTTTAGSTASAGTIGAGAASVSLTTKIVVICAAGCTAITGGIVLVKDTKKTPQQANAQNITPPKTPTITPTLATPASTHSKTPTKKPAQKHKHHRRHRHKTKTQPQHHPTRQPPPPVKPPTATSTPAPPRAAAPVTKPKPQPAPSGPGAGDAGDWE